MKWIVCLLLSFSVASHASAAEYCGLFIQQGHGYLLNGTRFVAGWGWPHSKNYFLRPRTKESLRQITILVQKSRPYNSLDICVKGELIDLSEEAKSQGADREILVDSAVQTTLEGV